MKVDLLPNWIAAIIVKMPVNVIDVEKSAKSRAFTHQTRHSYGGTLIIACSFSCPASNSIEQARPVFVK